MGKIAFVFQVRVHNIQAWVKSFTIAHLLLKQYMTWQTA